LRNSITTADREAIEQAAKLGIGRSELFEALEDEPFEFDEPDDESNMRRGLEGEITWITFRKLIDKII
jgi:hypothetical protein